MPKKLQNKIYKGSFKVRNGITVKKINNQKMIQIKNLKKSFRTEEVETLALNNVNLKVEEGEFVAIMGPSGCGKSTLLNIIGMLDNPNEGSYHFADQEVC